MKKIVLALMVLLITAPSMGAVIISITAEGGGVARIDYDASGEGELPRAFGLDITASGGANITAIGDFHQGESSDGDEGYGIFMGSIQIDVGGNVTSWADPVAPGGSPGSVGILGTPAITVEMGSLYDNDVPADAPDDAGMLCKVEVDAACTLSVTLNTTRGGVVMESGASASVDLSAATDVSIEVSCFPDGAEYAAQRAAFDAYVANGADPTCWCPEATGGNKYQCDGDTAWDTEGMAQFRVYNTDYDALCASWMLKIDTADPCADIDHKAEGMAQFRVYNWDYDILVANWMAKSGDLPGNCPRPDVP